MSSAAEEHQWTLLLVSGDVEYPQKGEHMVPGIYLGIEFDAQCYQRVPDENGAFGRGFGVDGSESFSGRAAQGGQDVVRIFTKNADTPSWSATQYRP